MIKNNSTKKLARLVVGLVLVTSALALACDVIYPDEPENLRPLDTTPPQNEIDGLRFN